MSRINILDSITSNKIAAGEVVERPSSVAKELIENSLDANSKKIVVEIEDGGQGLLRITDDGDGIHPEDVEKAFTTHGTSKISKVEDIYHIGTLGFRGEALPSIAAVSDIKLSSRNRDFDYGKEISYSGGNFNYVKEVGKSIGTTVEVKNLFFNVPARQKFLKTPKHEGSLISDYVMRLALSNSNVSFNLFKDGKKSIETFGNGNLKDTIRALYGKSVYENIIEFENHNDVASAYGFIGNADISKGSRNYQSIFVNKRYIKNKMICTAVENAFKSFLTVNKFPFFVLFIDIFPELIDVNIHPAKSEIKFSDDRSMFKLVFDGVHTALRKSMEDTFLESDFTFGEKSLAVNKEKLQNLHNEINTLQEQKVKVTIPLDFAKDEKIEHPKLNLDDSRINKENVVESVVENPINNGVFREAKKETLVEVDKSNLNLGYDSKNYFKEDNNDYKYVSLSKDTCNENRCENSNITTEVLKENSLNNVIEVARQPKIGRINVIGQFNKTYILGELNKELYIIDQHAAHEKILFEKYSKEIDTNRVISQILLTSIILELSFEEYSIYLENEEIFKGLGFKIESFGDNTISIREVPILLKDTNAEKLFYEILENLRNMGSGKNSEVKFEKLSKMACRSAVKANDSLSLNEMEHLLEELRYIDQPFTCPHGRPTIIKYSLYEIEKMFKRIQ